MIETPRLLLRRFTDADLDDLAVLHGDPEVMRRIDDGRPVPREAVRDRTLPSFLREYEELPEGLGHFAAVERGTGRFVGWISLTPAQSVGLAEDGGTELGYRVLPAMWGKGYAPEGAAALIRYAVAKAGVERVVATTMAVNASSRRVMEKVGLRYVRTFFEDWPDPIEGAEHGDVVYELRTGGAAAGQDGASVY